MTEHTPTLNHLRAEYLDLCTKRFGYSTQYAEEWDRALAAHDAEVRESAAAEEPVEQVSP
jgi:hypothetical protein